MGSEGEGTDAGPWGNGNNGGDPIPPPVGPGGNAGEYVWPSAWPALAITPATKTARSSFPRISCRPHMLTTED